MIHFRTLTIALTFAAVSLTGCGGDNGNGSPPPAVTTQILSDPVFDGDIEQTSPISFTVTQGMSASVQSVFAGIDPVALTEFRTFLDFPLTGPSGIPRTAIIDRAFLDIYINSLQPGSGTLPLRIELVSFEPPTLIPSDFDQGVQPPAYIIVSPSLIGSDVGTNVSIDVTSLMVEAQNRGLNDFQVRVMEDLGPAIPVLMEINDTTGANRGTLAPALTVTYF